MSINLDVPNNVGNNIFYTTVSQHRVGGNSNKSIWSISLQEEVNCFQYSLSNNWLENYIGWGLRLSNNNQMEVLGYNRLLNDLKIAKFIDGCENDSWHGYPADYRNKIQDRPPFKVLKEWGNNGFIHKHQISKIRSGKQCAL